MKFGEQLQDTLVREFRYQYMDYDALKSSLKSNNGRKWSEDDESAFVSQLERELDKVYNFQTVKATELSRRIRDCQGNLEHVLRLKQSGGASAEEVQDEFDALEEVLSDIIADVHDLQKFTALNYTAFHKIIKKHDKHTGWYLRPIFRARLAAKPFFKENYDAYIVQLSKLYDTVRNRGEETRGDSAAGGTQQNFVRQTTKYWVHSDNVTELKLYILKYLPVLVFSPNKEFTKEDSAISSIYFDNRELELYRGRLEKSEGAEAIRLRWYGGMETNTIFVERKTHREDWTGQKSVKARFPIKEKYVNAYLAGTYRPSQIFEKMRNEGKKTKKEIDDLEKLADEIQKTVIKRRLRPVCRSFYNRTAFQLPGDARVRISLDTELAMTREDDFDGIDRTKKNWRRMDIGIDYPFSQISERDVELFPHAVLEVKLQTQHGQEAPIWIRRLTQSHLVEAVPKFSKFIHGVSALYPRQVSLLPFWTMQMDVDIRKPALEDMAPSRVTTSLTTSDVMSSSDGNILDDEERLGSIGGPRHSLYSGSRNTSQARLSALRRAIGNAQGNEEDEGEADEEEQETNESTPLLRGNGNVPAVRDTKARALTLVNMAKEWFSTLRHRMTQPRYEPLETRVVPGTVFETKFRAPPGKLIAVPVRVEPKTYFALERTFLRYMDFSILCGSISTALLNFGTDRTTFYASLCFSIVAALTLCYSLLTYIWRAQAIADQRAVRYDDRFGPTAVATILIAAFIINIAMRAARG